MSVVFHMAPHLAAEHASKMAGAAAKAGLSFSALLQILFQFGFGALPILMDVLGAFTNGKLDTTKLPGLLAKDGPLVAALLKAITDALGVSMPVLPTA